MTSNVSKSTYEAAVQSLETAHKNIDNLKSTIREKHKILEFEILLKKNLEEIKQTSNSLKKNLDEINKNNAGVFSTKANTADVKSLRLQMEHLTHTVNSILSNEAFKSTCENISKIFMDAHTIDYMRKQLDNKLEATDKLIKDNGTLIDQMNLNLQQKPMTQTQNTLGSLSKIFLDETQHNTETIKEINKIKNEINNSKKLKIDITNQREKLAEELSLLFPKIIENKEKLKNIIDSIKI